MAKVAVSKVSSSSVRMIVALDKINYDLSRNRLAGMDAISISALADNIKIHGVLQNVILNEMPDGTFDVMGGIRRTMAAKEAGLKDIPALVYKSLSREDHFIIQMDENGKRENPSFIDRAKDMQRAKEEFKWSQKKISEVFAFAQAEVSKFLRLLELPESIQKAIHEGEYTLSSAFRLLNAKPEAVSMIGDITSELALVDKSKEEKKAINAKVIDKVDAKLAEKGIDSGISVSATTKAEAKAVAKAEEKKRDLPAINLNGAAMPSAKEGKTPSSVLPPSKQPLPPLNQPVPSDETAPARDKTLDKVSIMGLLLFLETNSEGKAQEFMSDLIGHIEQTKTHLSRHELVTALKELGENKSK